MSFGIASENREKWREWILSEDESLPFIQRALELGINFFDTAEIYSDGGSESLLGKALKMVLDNGSTSTKFRREDIVIATKVHPSRTMNMRAPFGHVQKSLGRKSIFDAVEGSLRRLQTDYIGM
jgi:aryl-alcohol dehydrogenase-like predicted oxidoreductase